MSKIDIYTAFDDVLEMMKKGHSREECLQRYPQFAKDLDEIMDIAFDLDGMKAEGPDKDVLVRNKTRVLLAASSIRSKDVKRFKNENRSPLFSRFARFGVSVAMLIGLLVTTGTGLVNASSTALPGDNLYPVKRGWENVALAFVFSDDAKHELEKRYDEERYDEINKLYEEDRFEQVTFSGVIQEIGAEHMIIGGLFIKLDDDLTNVSDFAIGDTVSVIGETDDGVIEAESLQLHTVGALTTPSDKPVIATLPPNSIPTATALTPIGTTTATLTPTSTTVVIIQSVEEVKDSDDKKDDDKEKDDDEHEDELDDD